MRQAKACLTATSQAQERAYLRHSLGQPRAQTHLGMSTMSGWNPSAISTSAIAISSRKLSVRSGCRSVGQRNLKRRVWRHWLAPAPQTDRCHAGEMLNQTLIMIAGVAACTLSLCVQVVLDTGELLQSGWPAWNSNAVWRLRACSCNFRTDGVMSTVLYRTYQQQNTGPGT
jgi:hypothetical protein